MMSQSTISTPGALIASTQVDGLPVCNPLELLRNESDNDEGPMVIRSWGGERVWSVWLCYTASLILIMLVPLNGIKQTAVYAIVQLYFLDKVIHVALFSTLTGISGCVFFPFCRDSAATVHRITAGRVFLLVSVVGSLGVGLECLQPLTGRSFEWLDMAANLFSIIPGFAVFLMMNELRHFAVSRY